MENIRRPRAVVLGDSALIPAANLLKPPPDQFTHRLSEAQPYYYSEADSSSEPDGTFPAGTRVVLLGYKGGKYCRVADGRGLYVETLHAGLTPL